MPKLPKLHPKRSIIFVIVAVVAAYWGMAPVFAHQSPGSCNGNRLSVNIIKDKTQVQQGDLLTYTVTSSNVDGIASIACDFTNVDIDVTLPAVDGTPTGTVVNIQTNATYPNNTALAVIGTVPYTVNVNANVTDIVAQVTASGTLHDAPVDHTANILKTIGTSVVWPAPAGSGAGAGSGNASGTGGTNSGSSTSRLPGLPKTGVPSRFETS